MDSSTFRRNASRLAALSFVLLSLGCATGSLSRGTASDGTDDTTDFDALRRRPHPRRDAGATSDAGPVVVADAGSTPAPIDSGVRDSGVRDSGVIVARDAGSTTPAVDAGTDAGTPPTTPTAWRPFGASSPWNTRIASNVAIRPDSAQLIEHLRTSTRWPGLGVNVRPWGIPMYSASSSTPLVRVVASLSNEGENRTFWWPVPAGAESDPEADGHLLIVDRATGREYDFWNGRRQADGSWTCSLCATADMNGTGVRPPKGGSTPWYESHGSRACGFPLAAGLITAEEMRAGRIDHALAIAYPGIRQRWFRSPASTGHPANGIVSPDRGIPCGGRIQLDPSVNVDALGLTPSARIIARALQEYGAYVGDYSESISLYADGSPEARAAWDSGLLDEASVNRIPIERLRVVEWGTLISDG
ncbi:hypothetical protein [Sandaracinus amylolyticus]|uniref:Uncharacterized protein n=1 Tax=Sandaracinus amylolyticus TaxID=927083 RepID=A0A0F6YKW3_9BACT|nr:hypothetical protein [Sandaracinus amylolyticus]AKF09163.1 hypothetical protein DB32_006312 [Sandaracinus amylolyticus]